MAKRNGRRKKRQGRGRKKLLTPSPLVPLERVIARIRQTYFEQDLESAKMEFLMMLHREIEEFEETDEPD